MSTSRFLSPAPPLASLIARLSVLLVLFLAAGLRFYRIDYQSYWNDEGNTRVLVSRPLPTLLANTAADIHPPGYYLILKAWRTLAGEREFALRGFSALAGVVLVALLYRLGREWFGRGAGLAAAGLGAINPFLVYYSQEARMYALLAVMGAASFLFFGRLWRASRPNWALITIHGLVTALGLYTHYAFSFVVLAQAAALALAWGWRRTLAYLSPRSPALPGPPLSSCSLSQCLAGLFYLPWLPTAYRQLTGWPAAREFHPFWESLLDLVRYLAFGRTLPTGEALWGLAAVGGLAVVGAWKLATDAKREPGPSRRPSRFFALWSLSLWLLVPAGLTLAFGLLTEAFSKFLLVAVPALALLLGAALAGRPPLAVPAPPAGRPSFNRPPRSRWPLALAAWCLGLGSLYVTGLSLHNLYFNPAYFRDDYRGIARHLQALSRAGDAVITNAPNQAEAFDYYLRSDRPGQPPLFPLPDSRPLDRARTAAQLADIAGHYERIFVLYWGDAQADPERFIESWLNANTFKAGDLWFGQVRLATYAAARPALEPAALAGARFGEALVLDGYTLRAAGLAAGDIVQITFFWRAEAKLAARYKVFVHLYGDVNTPPLAQQDGEPGGGLALTTTWTPGQRYADNHGLLIPADLPPGEYRLMAGLYDLVTGVRLPVAVGDTIVGDRLDLGPLVIRQP